MIVCVLSVRNEAYHLPTFLAHVAPYVDGFVALDDGSTDATASILRREPRMVDVLSNPARADHEWREDENRRRLVLRAKEIGAAWVLALDPDERMELRVLRGLRGLRAKAEARSKSVVAFRFRELWDSPRHYRVDGIWGRKEVLRFFRLPDPMTFSNYRRLHGPWYPAEIAHAHARLRYPGNIYHLKMIVPESREARRLLYNGLDPHRRAQAIGYDYLTDETNLAIVGIPSHRRYEWSLVPSELRVLAGPTRSLRDSARMVRFLLRDSILGVARTLPRLR